MTDRDIRICDNKGFQLDLPNGVTVSVQLESCCSSSWVSRSGSNTAECAAFITGSDLSWVAVPDYTGPGSDEDGIDDSDTFYDDVVGHLNVSQVLDFINRASKLTGHEAKANPDSIGNKMVKSLEKGDGGSHGDYRDDPKIQEDERKVMDEIAIDEYFSNKESNDEDSA